MFSKPFTLGGLVTMDTPRGMVFHRTNCKDNFWLHANRRNIRAWGVDFNLSLAECRDHPVKVAVINSGIEKMSQYKLNDLLSRPLHCGRHDGECACPMVEDPNPPAGYDEDKIVASIDTTTSDFDAEGPTLECGVSYHVIQKTSPFLPITPKACYDQAVFRPRSGAFLYKLDTPWGLWEKLFRLGDWRVWNVQYDLTPALAATHEVILGKPGEPLEKMSQSELLKLLINSKDINDCGEAEHGSCAFIVAPRDLPADYDPCKPAPFAVGDRPLFCTEAIDRRAKVTPSMASSSKRDVDDMEEPPTKRREVLLSKKMDDQLKYCGLDEVGIGAWLDVTVRPSQLLDAIARNEDNLKAITDELDPAVEKVIQAVTNINETKATISEDMIRVEDMKKSMDILTKSIHMKEIACTRDDDDAILLKDVLDDLRILREEYSVLFAEKCTLGRKIRNDNVFLDALQDDLVIMNEKREQLSKKRLPFAKRADLAHEHDQICFKARAAIDLAVKSKDALLRMDRE